MSKLSDERVAEIRTEIDDYELCSVEAECNDCEPQRRLRDPFADRDAWVAEVAKLEARIGKLRRHMDVHGKRCCDRVLEDDEAAKEQP